MKVHELAKELNVESKELIEKIKELDIDVKSHLSVLNEEQIQKIKEFLNMDDEKIKVEHQSDQDEVKLQQWKPDLNRMICLRNISPGKLIYKSKRQLGYTIEWAKKGDENYIELAEFLSLKNTDRRFVTEPWVRIIEDDEEEILKYANIFQYYKGVLGIDSIPDILKLDFNSFKKKFDNLPKGYRNTVVEYAVEMIKNGMLDSIKIKNYIEETMDVDLDLLVDIKSRSRDKKRDKYVDFE